MITDRQVERRIICTIDRSYGHAESDIGKIHALYEILPNNELTPINSVDHFCDTERVFVTGQFTELQEKYSGKIFEATCITSSFEGREGDCRYVTRAASCSDVKGLVCSQIVDDELPDASFPHLTLSSKPLTKTILIRNNDNIYGPFEYSLEVNDISELFRLTIKAISTPLNNTPQFHIGKIGAQKCVQYLYEKDEMPIFLSNIKRCFDQAEMIDFITDEQIFSTYGAKIAQNSEIRSFNKGTIAQIRKSFANSVEQRKFPERFKRLFDALETANGWEGTRKELVDSFLTTPPGQKILENYIDTNRDEFFVDEKQAYLKKLESDYEKQVTELNELANKKEKIEADIRKFLREREEMELETEPKKSISTLSAEQKTKLDNTLQEKNREIELVSSEIAALEEKHARFKTMEALDQEIKELERDKERAQSRVKEMNSQVENVAIKLRGSNEQLTSRLLELKPHVDALSGIATKSQSKAISYNVHIKESDPQLDDDDIREDLIDGVLEELNSLGRKTDYNTVANILATIAQSQFTLFSGRPGTGKTSLAKLLGSSLGLGNRFLNIPVARGWTSSRDILGFYNALSSSFNSSATGLYEFLTHLNCEDEKLSAPAICLLDEFNLSQPEHYFSPFLEMADPESKRVIATGDQDLPHLEVPKYLRFLGTINNDESVQSLTPRMLDRSAIISFDDIEPHYDLSINPLKSIENSKIKPISGSKFIDLFAPKSLEVPQDIERILKLIIDTLREDKPEFGMPISVSFRKVKAIRSYHNVTSSMYIDSRLKALDFSVSQHIIPLLNGYGQAFGKRLSQLIEVIPDEMEITHKMLKRVIDIGNQNMFTYGFNI